MVSRQRWLTLSAIFALSLLFINPASAAEEKTIVWQANLEIPIVDRSALGTLVTTVDEDTGKGTWQFQGTIDDQFARASGTGEISGEGSTATISMTSIDMWEMSGLGPPELPATASIRTVRNLGYVSFGPAKAIPVALSEPIDFPIESGTYVLTTPGRGEHEVTVLPETGEGPASDLILARAMRLAPYLVPVSLVALSALVVVLRPPQRRASRTPLT